MRLEPDWYVACSRAGLPVIVVTAWRVVYRLSAVLLILCSALFAQNRHISSIGSAVTLANECAVLGALHVPASYYLDFRQASLMLPKDEISKSRDQFLSRDGVPTGDISCVMAFARSVLESTRAKATPASVVTLAYREDRWHVYDIPPMSLETRLDCPAGAPVQTLVSGGLEIRRTKVGRRYHVSVLNNANGMRGTVPWIMQPIPDIKDFRDRLLSSKWKIVRVSGDEKLAVRREGKKVWSCWITKGKIPICFGRIDSEGLSGCLSYYKLVNVGNGVSQGGQLWVGETTTLFWTATRLVVQRRVLRGVQFNVIPGMLTLNVHRGDLVLDHTVPGLKQVNVKAKKDIPSIIVGSVRYVK